MSNILLKTSILVCFPIFTSCITPRVCTQSGAFESGRAHALEGSALSFESGSICEDEAERKIFRTNFRMGYQNGQKKLCQSDLAFQEGRSDGADGKEKHLPRKFKICSNSSHVKLEFSRGYKDGLAEFCSTTKAFDSGVADGEEGLVQQATQQKYSKCGLTVSRLIFDSYMKGYQKGQNTFCTPRDIYHKAFSRGQDNASQLDLSSFTICSYQTRHKIEADAARGYTQGFKEYCDPANHMAMIERLAAEGSELAYDSEYQRCALRFPEIARRYEREFSRQRRIVVKSLCHYDEGYARGAERARLELYIDSARPSFCDAFHFDEYKEGFIKGWKKTKRVEICKIEDAYEDGYRQGRISSSSHYTLSRLCPRQFHGIYRDRFMDGFQDAQRNAIRREWRYHADGYAHCYVNGSLSKKSACSGLRRPPSRIEYGQREWRYHADGHAHCYVNGSLVKKSECSGIRRPSRRF